MTKRLPKSPIILGSIIFVLLCSGGRMLAGSADNLYRTLAGELYQADGHDNVRPFDKRKVELTTGKIARVYDLSRSGELLVGIQERKVIPNTEDINSTNLVVTDLEGSYAKQLTADTSVFQAKWSPKGGQFVYVTRDMKLYLATPDGRINKLISDGAVAPSWSADGTMLVYSHFDEPYTGAIGYTVGVATYELATDKEIVYTSGYDDGNPIFSSDKKRVLFYSSLRTSVASEYILNLADKKLEQITNVGMTNAYTEKGFIPVHLNALWSDDGRTVVFETRYTEKEVWMLRLDSSKVVQTRKIGIGESPSWVVNGKSLRFIDTTDNGRKVKKVELE